MSSPDPLTLLRAALTASAPPTLLDAAGQPAPLARATHLRFSQHPSSPVLALATPTRFTAREDDPIERHTLQQLYYAYEERETGGAEYMRKAAGMPDAAAQGTGQMKVVSIVDRKLVLDYLEGRAEAPRGRVVVEGSDPANRRASRSGARVSGVPGLMRCGDHRL